ncbi:MAG: hypothetical protein ABIT96_08155 [Ferruginibacter sp.]
MAERHRRICIVFIFSIFCCCKTLRENYFSYKQETFAIDTTRNLITSSSLISYGEYLFEFKKRTNYRDVFQSNTGKIRTTIYYDTIGVYLLSKKNSIYYEFDTFALNNTFIRLGLLKNKEFGAKFSGNNRLGMETTQISKPKDTMINNIKCFYIHVGTDVKGKDSLYQEIFLIKEATFNSLFKIGGYNFPDSEYSLIGFYSYNAKVRQGILQVIDDLRPLTELEIAICKNIVFKSKSYVTDTIKGLSYR